MVCKRWATPEFDTTCNRDLKEKKEKRTGQSVSGPMSYVHMEATIVDHLKIKIQVCVVLFWGLPCHRVDRVLIHFVSLSCRHIQKDSRLLSASLCSWALQKSGCLGAPACSDKTTMKLFVDHGVAVLDLIIFTGNQYCCEEKGETHAFLRPEGC